MFEVYQILRELPRTHGYKEKGIGRGQKVRESEDNGGWNGRIGETKVDNRQCRERGTIPSPT